LFSLKKNKERKAGISVFEGSFQGASGTQAGKGGGGGGGVESVQKGARRGSSKEERGSNRVARTMSYFLRNDFIEKRRVTEKVREKRQMGNLYGIGTYKRPA